MILRLRLLPSLLAASVGCATPLLAQEPDSIPAPEAPVSGVAPEIGECILRWSPIEPDTRSFTHRDAMGDHVTYLSGRYLWTCGSATMEADSAVKRDGPYQVEMFGQVVYEDTIRTLKSDRLLYFQLSDFIIAEGNVELLRFADGSTLHGPRVEFLRAVSGIDAVTTAPGRPTVTFYPAEGESREPFEVESDLALFAGEDEARFAGDAIITRSDLNARADTAYLTRTEGLGVMWGGPWIEAEGIRLEGDTIRFRSENEELESVQALGGGHATGERFEVRAEAIAIAVEDREVEHVWAYGEGMGEARSGTHRVHGDSLHFVMYGNQIDTVYALGEAVAIQHDTTFRAEESAAAMTDSAAAMTDSAAATTDSATAVDDSTAAAAGSTTAADSTTAAAGEEAVEPETEEEGATDAAGSEDADPEEGREAVSEEGEGPELALDGSMNWARADTLVAVFERPDPGDPAAADPMAADSAAGADPAMAQLLLAGNASALYRMVRDTAATARPSRNYLVGSRIQVDFEDGAPLGVVGENAIGVYLEPREVFGTVQDGAAADSAAAEGEAAADSSAVGEDPEAAVDSAAADTTAAPPDTVSIPPDTLSSPPAPAAVPPDTALAPPRASGAGPAPRSDGGPAAAPRTPPVAPRRPPPDRRARGAPAPDRRSSRAWRRTW